MQTRGWRPKGCLAWLSIGFVVLELIGILFVPGCGMLQLWVVNLVSQGQLARLMPAIYNPFEGPPGPYVSNPVQTGAFYRQNILYLSGPNGGTGAYRVSDGHFLYTTGGLPGTADERFLYTTSTTVASSPDTTVMATDTHGQQVWQYDAGHEGASSLQSVDGLLYYLGTSEYPATNEVVALNESNGGLAWRYNPGNGQQLSYIVANNQMYLMTSSALLAFDARSGHIRWQRSGSYNSLDGFFLDQATLYSLNHQGIQAINVNDGSLRWRVDYQGTFSQYFEPAFAGPVSASLSVMRPDGSLAALRLSDGQVRWHIPAFANPLNTSLQLENGLLYALQNSGSVIDAVDPQTGKLLWHISPQELLHVTQATFTIIGADQALLYLQARVAKGSSNSLLALDTSTGQLHWQKPLPPEATVVLTPQNISISSVVHRSNRPHTRWFTSIALPLYDCTETLHLQAISQQTGAQFWQQSKQETCVIDDY
jgi:outer membrane protein assembly factor BamB